jgi:biotin carboxylase
MGLEGHQAKIEKRSAMNTYVENEQKRVLLLVPFGAGTFRVKAFLRAAQRLHLEVVLAFDLHKTLANYWHVPLAFDFAEPEAAVPTIVELARQRPFDAILPVDDSGCELAAHASKALGLTYNSPQAAEAARDKLIMRTLMAANDVPCPPFRTFLLSSDPARVASQVTYPCVLKPLRLSASQGVIRADNATECITAFARLKRLLLSLGYNQHTTSILVEDFIPGVEVALEGILTKGNLKVLALFDKPDPLDGPFFEETIYVTPSRLPSESQREIAACAAAAAASLRLQEGPIHAELRVNKQGPWMLEVAGRAIGGLCSVILEFSCSTCLEELILRHALGQEVTSLEREKDAAGVMMIPIPSTGLLKRVSGVEEARAVPLITDIQITAKPNALLRTLPEGADNLGYIFARGDTSAEVEAALRRAHQLLRFDIEPYIEGLPRSSRYPPLPGETDRCS